MKYRQMPDCLFFRAIAVCLLLTNAGLLAIETNQIDDFSTGDINGWGGGANPTFRAEGGADGTMDGYLEIRRDVIPFHVGTKNTTRWAGDYLANNIKAIEFDLNRFDIRENNIFIRLLIFGPGGTFATKSRTPPVAVNTWEHHVFGLSADDLVFVGGGKNDLGINDLELTLANVTTLLIRHDAFDPVPEGNHPPHTLATIGIDNIRALDGMPTDVFGGTDIAGVPGWKSSPWYLAYNIDFWPWIFHKEHAWQFVFDVSTPESIFLFDFGLGEIIFLNESTYRWIFLYGDAPGWIFTFEDNTPDSRFFQRGDDGSLFSVPAGLLVE